VLPGDPNSDFSYTTLKKRRVLRGVFFGLCMAQTRPGAGGCG
jgi:hypothetical protein